MRDTGEKSSNHRSSSGGNQHHSSNSAGKGASSSNNTAGLFADIKAESTRGLELLDKIVNDAAQVKWILKNVLTSVSEIESSKPKCQNCASSSSTQQQHSSSSRKESSSGSPAKEKRDKKAKKAVLPMVSGHTVQRPSINITRVDVVARQREGSSNSNEQAPPVVNNSRRPGPSSKTRGGGVVGVKRAREGSVNERGGKKERSGRDGGGSGRRDSSSSSSSSGSSSSGSSSGSSRSSSTSRASDILSVTGGRGGSSSVGKSPTRKQPQQQQPKKSQPPPPQPPQPAARTVSPQHPHHGSASSRFLSSAHNVNAMKKKYLLKRVQVRVSDVTKLIGYRKTVRLSDLNESHVRAFWSEWRKPAPPQRRESSVVLPKEEKPSAVPSKPPPARRIGPKSKMAGLRASENKPHVTTTAEALRAKLREKFNKFKMTRNNSGGVGGSGSCAGGSLSGNETVALPDSTTNSNGSGDGALKVDKAKCVELDAIGLSVFVSAGEKKQHESVDEFVGKAMMDGGARSDLLEMKRDAWILMQNNKTGISSLRDDVNRGLKRVVGFGDEDDEVGVMEEYDDGHYLVGNFYFIAREGHPLALMRYIGSNTLPPCDSADKDAPPRGFMPVDLSSLSKSQISQLQELGGARRKSSGSSSSDDDESNKAARDDEEDEDDDEPIQVPRLNFDESSSDY